MIYIPWEGFWRHHWLVAGVAKSHLLGASKAEMTNHFKVKLGKNKEATAVNVRQWGSRAPERAIGRQKQQ
jgi:hypothetical protein